MGPRSSLPSEGALCIWLLWGRCIGLNGLALGGRTTLWDVWRTLAMDCRRMPWMGSLLPCAIMESVITKNPLDNDCLFFYRTYPINHTTLRNGFLTLFEFMTLCVITRLSPLRPSSSANQQIAGSFFRE